MVCYNRRYGYDRRKIVTLHNDLWCCSITGRPLNYIIRGLINMSGE